MQQHTFDSPAASGTFATARASMSLLQPDKDCLQGHLSYVVCLEADGALNDASQGWVLLDARQVYRHLHGAVPQPHVVYIAGCCVGNKLSALLTCGLRRCIRKEINHSMLSWCTYLRRLTRRCHARGRRSAACDIGISRTEP